MVRRVYASRGIRNLQRQLVGIGALQFADAAVIEDDSRQVIVVRKFDEHVFGRRRLAFGCLANDRQLELFEQNLLQLFR